MIVACQECGASISDAAATCLKCGAPPDAYLGAQYKCAECAANYRPAYPECRSCGAPRVVAVGETTNDLVTEIGSASKAPHTRSQGDARAPYTTLSNPPQESPSTNILSFEGRTNRLGYFLINLVAIPISLLCAAVLREGGTGDVVINLLLIVVAFVGLWIIVAAGWRRCHDAGWSGYWALLALLPLVSLVFGIVMLFVPTAADQHRSSPSATAT
ncbi:MAG: DUF805 domain-containing protein [Hyphomonadaceae bacterium]|nr:DUF805 domain-containing protein [Hyphomonadaceae bacterium]